MVASAVLTLARIAKHVSDGHSQQSGELVLCPVLVGHSAVLEAVAVLVAADSGRLLYHLLHFEVDVADLAVLVAVVADRISTASPFLT